MTRAEIAAAVAAELLERRGKGDPYAVGLAVADRLGAVAPAPAPVQPADGIDREVGTAVFVRRLADWPIEMITRLDCAIVATRSSGGGRMNRDAGWWRDAAAGGVRLVGMDWMTGPYRARGIGLAEAIVWTAEHGGSAYCLDVEAEWSGEDRDDLIEYVAEAWRTCQANGMELWCTSFSMLPRYLREPLGRVMDRFDRVIPQGYDRYAQQGDDYIARSVASWRAAGCTAPIIVGRGAFVDPDGVGPERARWRTPGEINAHRALLPEGASSAWWPPRGRPSWRAVDAMRG